MAYISVTNTLANGTVSDATQVNTNFTDITSGLSGGTKDIKVYDITAHSLTTDTVTSTGQLSLTASTNCYVYLTTGHFRVSYG